MLELVISFNPLPGVGELSETDIDVKGGKGGSKRPFAGFGLVTRLEGESMYVRKNLHDWGNRSIGRFRSRVRQRAGLRGQGLCTIWIRIGEGESGQCCFGR